MLSTKFFKWAVFLFILIPILTSCSKEMEDDEEYTEVNGVIEGRDGDTDIEYDEDEDEDDNDDGEEEGFEWEDDCFMLVFPIDLTLPDGSIVFVDSDSLIEEIYEEYEDVNIDSVEIPIPVFPISIILENGEEVEVSTWESLLEAFAACEDDDDDDDDDDEEGEDDSEGDGNK